MALEGILYTHIHNKPLMSHSSGSFQMFMQRGNYGTQQIVILEPIVEAMKSPSDKELDLQLGLERSIF